MTSLIEKHRQGTDSSESSTEAATALGALANAAIAVASDDERRSGKGQTSGDEDHSSTAEERSNGEVTTGESANTKENIQQGAQAFATTMGFPPGFYPPPTGYPPYGAYHPPHPHYWGYPAPHFPPPGFGGPYQHPASQSTSEGKNSTVVSPRSPVGAQTNAELPAHLNLKRRASMGKWTEREDETLRRAVKEYGGKNWKKIASRLPDRTDVQCLHRWQKVLKPGLVKGPWTSEEDQIVVDLVKIHGTKKWSQIARNLKGRLGKQCRERWYNHLDVSNLKDVHYPVFDTH